ncbi:hypothetical protein LCGC14_1088480 [marine sediment metagenome]|uniref:Uncharacterized protein n=1 Tax=marine sediment metagenome TaxID=412755 RepID=A0A0F9N0U2_9ZZZZ
MTGYHITIGYNAGRPGNFFEILKQKTREICDNPKAIIVEARRLNAPEVCSKGCCHLDNFADNYADSFETYGHPISIIEDGEDQQIMQLACASYRLKYHVRRAFVRLLIETMHKEEIEISVVVA